MLTDGKWLHVLVALGMVYHDKVLLLNVVLYLHISFSRLLKLLRKGIHILLVRHVTYFVCYFLSVYCLTQFCLNRIFGILRPRYYACVARNLLRFCFPIVFHFSSLRHHAGGRDISYIQYMLRTRQHYP